MADVAKSISNQVQRDYFVDKNADIFSELPPMPTNIMVELSNACNHKCIFCANPHMQRTRRHMADGFVERLLREAAAEGVRQVGFYTTGDPFVHKRLEQFVATARDLGFEYIYLSTNGGLATPERLRAVVAAGCHSIKFSINAATRETYAKIHGVDDFDKVMEHLTYISEYRKGLATPLRLYATCVVTRQAEPEMDAYKALLDPLVDEVFYTPCGNQSGQMSAAQAVLGYAENFNPNAAADVCAMPFNRLHVTAEGYLTLCCVDYQNYLTVADLAKMSLREAWANGAFKEMRRRHLDRHLEGTLCGNCWLGRRDQIQPLTPELSSPVDFGELYRTQTDSALKRLASDRPDSIE